MSYLDGPRIHFAGFFQADVSTVNNIVNNYDTANFKPEYQEDPWNPNGTGVFRFVDVNVTGGFLEGKLLTSVDEDVLIGCSLQDAHDKVAGKLVDLDPQQQMVSEIWGMQLRLTNADYPALFQGTYHPAGFFNLWRRQQEASAPDDQQLAATYQSVLEQVVWENEQQSPLLKALKAASAEGLLSIHINVFGYGRDPSIPRYTLGRLVGSIGPAQADEPKHFVMGRQLLTEYANNNPTAPKHEVYSFHAKVNGKHQITADFGNCLALVNADPALLYQGKLLFALLKEEPTKVLDSVKADEVVILGEVGYQQVDWYTQTAGIQSFDYAHQPWVIENIQQRPLALLKPLDACETSYQILVQEALGGAYVFVDNYVQRLNPGDCQDLHVYASKYGEPLAATVNTSVKIGGMGGAGRTSKSPVPEIGTPTDAISYPPSVTTNEQGYATLPVRASANGPGKPRGYIDNQLYGIGVSFLEQAGGYQPTFWNFTSILAFDKTELPQTPTWDEHIQPIMTQYGNLYPIMSRFLVDLSNYDSVVLHQKILTLAFTRPLSDPNYMPVTRDLAEDLRQMIVQWLTNPGADGKPVKSSSTTTARVQSQTPADSPREPADETLTDMQKAGKTSVLLQMLERQANAKQNDQ